MNGPENFISAFNFSPLAVKQIGCKCSHRSAYPLSKFRQNGNNGGSTEPP